jgi:hypothetical protein
MTNNAGTQGSCQARRCSSRRKNGVETLERTVGKKYMGMWR